MCSDKMKATENWAQAQQEPSTHRLLNVTQKEYDAVMQVREQQAKEIAAAAQLARLAKEDEKPAGLTSQIAREVLDEVSYQAPFDRIAGGFVSQAHMLLGNSERLLQPADRARVIGLLGAAVTVLEKA